MCRKVAPRGAMSGNEAERRGHTVPQGGPAICDLPRTSRLKTPKIQNALRVNKKTQKKSDSLRSSKEYAESRRTVSEGGRR